jgi:integrase
MKNTPGKLLRKTADAPAPPEVLDLDPAVARIVQELYGEAGETGGPLLAKAEIEMSDTYELEAQVLDKIREIFAEGTAPNTIKACKGDLRYFEAWHQARYDMRATYPVAVAKVMTFIAEHRKGMPARVEKRLTNRTEDGHEIGPGAPVFKARWGVHSMATVTRRVSSLSTFHHNQGLPNPCADPRVKALLGKSRKAAARAGEAPRQKRAAVQATVAKLLAADKPVPRRPRHPPPPPGEATIDIRDRALISFAFFSGGRRRSEVAGATLDRLEKVPEGYNYYLGVSKTDQDGTQGKPVPIYDEAARALDRWLEKLAQAGIIEGRIFRGLDQRGNIRGNLTGKDVALIIKKRAALAGIDDPEEYGGHSLRRGYLTEGGRRGYALGELMRMSGHKSVPQAMRYYEAGELPRLQAARMSANGGGDASPALPSGEKGSLPASPENKDFKGRLQQALEGFLVPAIDARNLVNLHGTLLRRSKIRYEGMRGTVCAGGEVSLQEHFWIELPREGLVVDCHLGDLFPQAQDLPCGVFRPPDPPGVRYAGKKVPAYMSEPEFQVFKRQFDPGLLRLRGLVDNNE